MAHKPAIRALRLPPENFDDLKIPKTALGAGDWFRVHQHGLSALHFSLSSMHRFSHEGCLHPCLYVSARIDTCLFERFGDMVYERHMAIPKSLWSAHCATCVQVPALQICDLTSAKTLSALRVDLGALMHNELAIPQAWGLALQRHPANFQGIRFRSRFDAEDCLAIFKRDGIEQQLREKSLGRLRENDIAINWLDEHKAALF